MARPRLLRPVGPRTDVRYMTRRELFRSAAWFLRAGGLTAVLFLVTAFSGGIVHEPASAHPFVQGAAFVLAVLTGMAFAAALYLDVRGYLRSEAYDPARVWHADHVARGPERLAIELHDSEIARARLEDGELVLRLEAYVHHSAGEPGRDAGTGWVHGAELRLRNARPAALPTVLPAVIADGTLQVGERRHENVVPLPLAFDGPVRFEVSLTFGATLEIEADALAVELLDDGECVEIFRP